MNSLKHIAFIMDGNGRWATARGLKRAEGHRAGVEALKRVLEACSARRVAVVSVFAFSTENWKRPKAEIGAIFSLIGELNDQYLAKENLSFAVNFFGGIEALPESVRRSVERVRERTKGKRGMIVNVMINYGGRAEIAAAANKLAALGKPIDEEGLLRSLYTGYLPEPDIIVRTAGERRLSNFMIYQCAYSELLFLDKLWPDMNASDVDAIIAEYNGRDRRFGNIKKD
ncbi:MAG: di-trans,poly-cis-decaprenylcistransferase [Clostridiales bacterium]|jgi:undecaprenyl diphosphate synthase|nr:di-trans,poly-cis-decaprenylcistransferase [Clostridiales bacterium]